MFTFLFIIFVISFTISDFSKTFAKSMNQDEIVFKRQYILESLASVDPGFTFNLAHNNDNNITGIFWKASYMRDNFKRFDNYIYIY